MSSILDVYSYPWSRPEAQQLHLMLSQLHPTAQGAALVAQRSGIDISTINTQQAVVYVWKDILEAAAPRGLTRALVADVHDRLLPVSPMRLFLEDLLADRPTPTSGEPRDAEGAPRFVTGADDVSEPEALLYHDDLTVPIGRLPDLIATLQTLAILAPAVCKLTVDINRSSQYGTAFLIRPDLLITNWHVLHGRSDGTRASVVTAEFGYDDDGRGGIHVATPVLCDVASIIASKDDDWAIIRTKERLAEDWPIVKLSSAVAPTQAGAAFIIQHPRGERKRVAIVRNQVSYYDERVVHYLTDTQVGSSGSPVFDDQGQLIAIHHAGGRPQEVLGRPPLRKNEGIRISRIIQILKAQGVST